MLYVRLLLLIFCLYAVSACSSRQGTETMDTQPVVFESELSCVCPDSAGNFLIKDASFIGKDSAGDPIWRP